MTDRSELRTQILDFQSRANAAVQHPDAFAEVMSWASAGIDLADELIRVLEALQAVEDLHRCEVRWGNDEWSISVEEFQLRATENADGAGWDLDGLTPFSVCAECFRVEASEQQRGGHVSALESLWPCRTATSLEV